jgi:hypothetical protein
MSDYGVRHPDGSVTVMVTGHPFPSREQAEADAREMDGPGRFGHCESCGADDGSGAHIVVSRPGPAPWSEGARP